MFSLPTHQIQKLAEWPLKTSNFDTLLTPLASVLHLHFTHYDFLTANMKKLQFLSRFRHQNYLIGLMKRS